MSASVAFLFVSGVISTGSDPQALLPLFPGWLLLNAIEGALKSDFGFDLLWTCALGLNVLLYTLLFRFALFGLPKLLRKGRKTP